MAKRKSETNILLDLLSKDTDPQSFDINEQKFYEDQVTLTRKYLLDTYNVDMEPGGGLYQNSGPRAGWWYTFFYFFHEFSNWY